MHDVTGALTLVMSDAKWDLMPINLTNPVDVAAGQQPVYRNRPAYPQPAAHANNATSAVVNIHRLAATRHNDFMFASSTSSGKYRRSQHGHSSDHLSEFRAVHAHPDHDNGDHGQPARRDYRR
jgi:hypothetical protein